MPNLASAHYYLAEAYKATGKWDEAKREYEVVVNQYGMVNQRMTEFARSNLQDIDIQRRVAVGESPLPFEVVSITGEKISPDKYRGKVLLIDFWATWCRPCIAEMPHVKEVYAKYREKGFEIVGISLDRQRSDLDSYIASNKIAWPQYFDGKYWNNDIAKQYGVKSIPATFLIDREGKIRYKSLRGKQLEVAVEKLVSESL
jgi:peroxiredoxin